MPQRQFPLDAIERIYCSFANTLGAMRLNTTCSCNACRNMGSLDLKFFLHHGEYAMQTLAGRTELQGPEVIRLHRLMKNSVTKATGIKAYALVTEQAADAIGLPDFFAGAIRHVEHSDDFGDTVCHVYDLAPVFARWRASRRILVERDEPLAFELMECDLPVPPAVAWAYVTDVEKKIRWQQGLDGMTMTGLARGRVAPGATQHCAHGKDLDRARDRRLAAVRLCHLAHPARRWAPWCGRRRNSRRSTMAARICRCAARSRKAQIRWRRLWCA